jgi:hypothetical protein
VKLQGQVLRIRPDFNERLEDVRGELREHPPPAREQRVGLQIVGNPAALHLEGADGRAAGMDEIPLHNDRIVARARDGEGSRKAGDATAGDDEPHAPTLSSVGVRGKR